MRTLTCIAVLGAALLLAHSAFAASTAAKVCASDIKAQCGDVMKPGGAALKDCMKKHFSDLSADCQVSIIRATAVRKDCRADAKKFCSDAKGAALASCMKSHAADLSDDCKGALAKDSAK